MCGRFTRQYTWAELHALYMLSVGFENERSNLQPRYNICPTTTIDAVVERDGKRAVEPMRWGLVPSWWKKTLKELPATFNARAETVAEKPMFRSAFKRNRCIIPASGYFEWTATAEKKKQPHYFTRRDGEIISIAGLYEEWKNPETGKPLRSCTMIIGAANDFVSPLHDRMPIILERDQIASWLTGDAGTDMLRAADNGVLQEHAVSMRVNSSKADENDATLIEQL
ncbi:MAG TPA: SOS response-associated peptidase [Xanthobacteraceae bacterium]|nr:SOS response-associated peptidase [Xanthobacteraceae bacterium]